jgi:hypothetical protein
MDAEVALRGEMDRNPLAPHRPLHGDLEELWRQVKCWGPGRAQTFAQFEGSDRQEDWRRLVHSLESFRTRLHRVLLYLGIDPSLAQGGAEQQLGSAPAPHSDRPVWDATVRVLRFRGEVCKQYKRPAPDQEKILEAFQEDGWPDGIDDPLTPGKLATTVELLNKRLRHIRFCLNGNCAGVVWRVA